MAGALDGIVVVDLAGSVASAYCTRLLADLGADVTLVPTRIAQPGAQSDEGLLFALNYGKRLLEAGSDEEARALVARADVVVTGRLPEAMAAEGLDMDALRIAHPRLIQVSITHYGLTGPYRDWVGDEITDYALGGYHYFGGDPQREPLMVPGEQAQHHAGMQGALAALVALTERDRSGLGQLVDISAVEAMLSAHSWTSVAWTHEGQVLSRTPTDLIRCADGWVYFMLTNLEGIGVLIGQYDLPSDPRFATVQARLQHRDTLHAMLGAWCATRTMEAIYRTGQELRVAVTPVSTVRDLFLSPQLTARQWFRTVEHPAKGKVQVPGMPYRIVPSPGGGGQVSRFAASARSPFSGAADEHGTSQAGSLLPLAGLRIVELTANWAGPLAGRYLADLGAEVIKVESPTRPATRALHFAGNDGRARPYNRSGYFNKLNRNKLGVVLDIATERGRELFLRLIARADVFIENNSVRVLGNLGISHEVLRRVKPDIILCSMSGFGQTGPERDYVAYGSNIETVSGLAALMTYHDDPTPHRTGSYYADPVAGAHGAIAILAALRHRARTGEGSLIDLSLLESAAALFGEALMAWSLHGRLPAPRGNRHPIHAPQGVYRCAGNDSWLALTVRGEEEWRALCGVLGREDLASDAALASPAGRRLKHDAIDAAISQWCVGLDHYDAARRLQAVRVPAAPVLANYELLSDPHLHARGFYVPVPHPEVGVLPFPGFPWRFSRTPGAIRHGAPCFGEHNHHVFRHILGLTEPEIAELYERRITSDDPLLPVGGA